MAASTWVKLVGKSFAGAAVIAAAQLGVGQALGILDWDSLATGDGDLRRRLTMWLVFIFAAAVLGGVAAARHSVRSIRAAIANRRAVAAATRRAGIVPARNRAVAGALDKAVDAARATVIVAARVGGTFAAAVGAAAAFPLVWVPARMGVDAATQMSIAIAAGVGIAIGVVLAVAALSSAPIAAGAGATVVWVWAFALTSAGLAMMAGGRPGPPRLGMIDAPHLITAAEWWLGPNLMVAIAAVLGIAVATTARWVGAHRLGIALSGFAGPAVVASAYLVAGPGATGDLIAPYIAALLAATVGLLASAATAAAARSTAPFAAARTEGHVAVAPGGGAIGAARSYPAIQTRTPASPSALPGPAPLRAIEAAPVGKPATPTRAVIEGSYDAPEPLYAPPTPAVAAGPSARPVGRAAATKARTAPPEPAPAPAPAEPSPAVPIRAEPSPAVPIRAEPSPAVPIRAEPQPTQSQPKQSQPKQAAKVPHQLKGRAARRQNRARGHGRGLDKREREHVDWVQNLVNLPNDPELNVRGGR